MSLDLHTVKYVPLGGFSYIPLPKFLAAKKAIINLKNEDNKCFKWAIARALNPVEKNSELIDKKLRENQRINLKIIILQFLLMYLVMKKWFIFLE